MCWFGLVTQKIFCSLKLNRSRFSDLLYCQSTSLLFGISYSRFCQAHSCLHFNKRSTPKHLLLKYHMHFMQNIAHPMPCFYSHQTQVMNRVQFGGEPHFIFHQLTYLEQNSHMACKALCSFKFTPGCSTYSMLHTYY